MTPSERDLRKLVAALKGYAMDRWCRECDCSPHSADCPWRWVLDAAKKHGIRRG